jgi:hypothetical protein
MWILDAVSNTNGEQILRWMFLFAAPQLFQTYEAGVFSLLHLLTAFSALAVANGFGAMLSAKVKTMNDSLWQVYGRMLSFLGHIISVTISGLQIWSGFIVANLVTSMFERHSSVQIFAAFTITGIFLLGAVNSAFTSIQDLR